MVHTNILRTRICLPGGGKNITDLGDGPPPGAANTSSSSAGGAGGATNGVLSDLLSSAMDSSGLPGGSGANPRQSKIDRLIREGLLTKGGAQPPGFEVIKAEQGPASPASMLLQQCK